MVSTIFALVSVNPTTIDLQRGTPSRFSLVNLLCAIGFGLVVMTICLPSMPSWRGVFNASQASVQLSFSSFVLAFGVAQVIYGPLSDNYGRRRLLMFGFVLAALGSVAAAFASTLPALTVARFIQGAGAGAGMVLGRALVQDNFTGADKARVMAYIGMAMGMCAPVATVVGGQLHVYFGWRANFVLSAVLACVLLLTTWSGLPPDAHSSATRSHWFRDMMNAYGQLLRVPTFIAYSGIVALSTGTFYLYLAGAPSVLANYGVGPSAVGFFIMFVPVSYIAGNFLTSRLVKRFGESNLMFVGQCLGITGITLVLALALWGVRTPFAVAGPLLILGLGQGLLMPSALAGTVSVIPAVAGAAAGVAGLAQQLSGAFGGYAIGFFKHDSAVDLAVLMLLFMVAAFASQLWLRRLQSKARRDPA